jgi:hypothetical protein
MLAFNAPIQAAPTDDLSKMSDNLICVIATHDGLETEHATPMPFEKALDYAMNQALSYGLRYSKAELYQAFFYRAYVLEEAKVELQQGQQPWPGLCAK